MSLKSRMLSAADPSQVEGLSRFFKTGPGQYGEGDRFLGIKVPVTRAIVKECWRETSFDELEECLTSEYHELRLAALLCLVEIFAHAGKRRGAGAVASESSAFASASTTVASDPSAFASASTAVASDPSAFASESRQGGEDLAPESLRQRCIDFYLSHMRYINNWDLVDLSCYPLLGEWLLDCPSVDARSFGGTTSDAFAVLQNGLVSPAPSGSTLSGSTSAESRAPLLDCPVPRTRQLLYDLAQNGTTIWERRIGIVSTMTFVRNGQLDDTYALAEIFLKDGFKLHDLLQKAVGWLLREAGKRDPERLLAWLREHGAGCSGTSDGVLFTQAPVAHSRAKSEACEKPHCPVPGENLHCPVPDEKPRQSALSPKPHCPAPGEKPRLPRTMLRYAIEKFPPELRAELMQVG